MLCHPGDIEVSHELGYRVVTSNELRRRGFAPVVKEIKETLGDTPCFLSFDIDFVDPAFAPGTGTPEVGGFTSFETLEIIRSLIYPQPMAIPSNERSAITFCFCAYTLSLPTFYSNLISDHTRSNSTAAFPMPVRCSLLAISSFGG